MAEVGDIDHRTDHEINDTHAEASAGRYRFAGTNTAEHLDMLEELDAVNEQVTPNVGPQSDDQHTDWTDTAGSMDVLPTDAIERQHIWDEALYNDRLLELVKSGKKKSDNTITANSKNQKKASDKPWKYSFRPHLSATTMSVSVKEDKVRPVLHIDFRGLGRQDFRRLVQRLTPYKRDFLTQPPLPVLLSVYYDDCKFEVEYGPTRLWHLFNAAVRLVAHGRSKFAQGKKTYVVDTAKALPVGREDLTSSAGKVVFTRLQH